MDDLIIEATEASPAVEFRSQAGHLAISGRSYPEDPFSFFDPVLRWVEEFVAQREQAIRAELRLSYYNSSSAKVLFDLFDLLAGARERGQSVDVYWFYEPDNEAMLDAGREFRREFPGLEIRLSQGS